jgi:cyclophilin family peptidyl-prolyl cis-trans isomerase
VHKLLPYYKYHKKMNTTRWLTSLIIAIVILAGLQFYLNTKQDSSFNEYGETATTTPSTVDVSTTPVAPAASPVSSTSANINNPTKNFMNTITIETNKGTIVFETYNIDAPNTVKNFITLAEKGFYDNLIFHRVIKDFMIQGGDPTGTGRGGPGYQFADELNPATDSYKAGYARGTVAMANSGPDTNGSQFFIMHKDVPLPHNYSIFGRVVSGMDIVDAIANSPVGANDKPVSDIVMKKVTVSTK